MDKFEKIIEIQGKINDLMKKYEDYTRKLLVCDIDEISGYIGSRNMIIKKIDILNNEILEMCDKNSFEYLAYKNLCDRSELTDNLKEIFDLRQEFNGIAARVKSMDPEITERISIEKDKLLVKIKKNNTGQNAKAAKYFNAGLSQGSNIYFPENKKKI